MHMFEGTTQIQVDSDLTPKGYRAGTLPVQFVFALKERNMKKLNSHKWLFRAISPMLNPKVCVLFDAGTRPKTDDSIYMLWKSFDRNEQVAGACGEISVQLGDGC